MKHLFVHILWMTLTTHLCAQEQSSPRDQPPPRSVDVANPVTPQGLPTIDLPEFVITGSAVINPPDVQKGLFEESGIHVKLPDRSPGARDRETIDLGQRFKQSLVSGSEGFYGMAGASLGTFFTGRAFAAFGRATPTYDVLGEAKYSRTQGFMRFTDASSGKVKARGSLLIDSQSEILDDARVAGDATYGVAKYKLYGSSTPSAQRGLTSISLQAGASTSVDAPVPLSADLRFSAFGIDDSSARGREDRFSGRAGATLPIFDFPLLIEAGVDLTGVTAESSNSLSLVTLTVGSQPLSVAELVFQISATGSVVKGMAGQKGSYFYPRLTMRYSGVSNQVLFFNVFPEVSFASFEGHLERHPYLSSRSSLRHEVHRWKLSGGVESQWTEWLQTRVEGRFQSTDDYPLYADTSGAGFWTLVYGGRTSILALKLDGVANITANDYFAFGFTVRNAENSLFGQRVPSVAEAELSVSYTHWFPFAVSVSPSLSYLGPRKSSAASGETVGSCLWSGIRAEYSGIDRLSVALEIRNILNRKFEVFRGYRADPFVLSLGLSYRW